MTNVVVALVSIMAGAVAAPLVAVAPMVAVAVIVAVCRRVAHTRNR